MEREFLTSLHCPYSGSVFVLADVIQEDLGQINYGIVTSEAGDFPIVEGILRLQVDEYRAPIVEHVRQNRLAQALTIALDDWPFHGRARAAINFASGFAFRRGFNSAAEQLSRLKRSLARTVTDGNATFAEIATKLSPGHVAHWEIYRFSMPGFLSTFPLAHLVRSEGQVLNFACGSGQESFVIARMWPNVKIVCADNSFCSLYMAKKYFAPEAIYVSLNGDYLLPFESGQFSTIFSSDTLHIIDSKLNLAQEFKRVGDEKAVTLLPHLHNRLVSPYAKSLTPRGYRQLFRDVEVRMMPDDQVVRDYFFDDLLDPTRAWSEEELAASGQHVSIIACADSSAFVRKDNLWEQRLASIRHPCINPVYLITGEPGSWNLRRQVEDRYAQKVTGIDCVCLPDTLRVTARSIDTRGLVELQRTDPSQFVRLVKSLVVLDLPDRFLKQSQGMQHDKSLLPERQQAVL